MPYSILPQFPNSISEPLEQKSPKDNRYNCIAWAFGINNLRLWPNNFPFEVWPPNIPNTVTLDAFIKLYELIGYQICNNSLLETSKEKIAIFTLSGRPTHAAKQLSPDYGQANWGGKMKIANIHLTRFQMVSTETQLFLWKGLFLQTLRLQYKKVFSN